MIQKPITFNDAIKNFKSGQVYEVLYQDHLGNF